MTGPHAAYTAAADQLEAAGAQVLAGALLVARRAVTVAGPTEAVAWLAHNYATACNPLDVAGLLAVALVRLVELEREQ